MKFALDAAGLSARHYPEIAELDLNPARVQEVQLLLLIVVVAAGLIRRRQDDRVHPERGARACWDANRVRRPCPRMLRANRAKP